MGEILMQNSIMIPSRYPLNWFDFSIRWRIIASPVLALIRTLVFYSENNLGSYIFEGTIIFFCCL